MTLFAYCFGITYLVIFTFSTPLYLRIVYVFLNSKTYRNLRCYQIMTQLGIVQCLMGPGWALGGLVGMLGYDPYSIGCSIAKVTSSTLRIETGLSFVLALDRVKIVCKMHLPDAFYKVITAAVWLFGLSYFALSASPIAHICIDVAKQAPTYNYSYPYTATLQKVGYFYTLIVSFSTLILYITMAVYLVKQQKLLLQGAGNFKEKWIFTQALIRFAFDALLTVLFHIGPSFLPPTTWITPALIVGHLLNHISLPPALYLYLNREFLKRTSGTSAGKELRYKRFVSSIHDQPTRLNQKNV